MAGPITSGLTTDIVCRDQSNIAAGTTSLTINPPTIVDGDLLIMCLSHKGTGFATVPAGWTLIGQDVEAVSGIRGELYWKLAASESGSYSVTGLATVALGAIASYVGADTVTPIDVVATQPNAAPVPSGGPYTPAITTLSKNSMVVTLRAGSAAGTVTTPSLSNPNGYGNGLTPQSRILTIRENASTSGCGLSFNDGLVVIPSAMGAFKSTISSSLACVGIIAAIRPQVAVVGSATRLFATGRSVGTRLVGPPLGSWVAGDSDRENRGDFGHDTFFLAPQKSGGGPVGNAASNQISNSLSVANQNNFAYRWVTAPLTSGVTLGGTLTVCLNVSRLATFPPTSHSSATYAIYVYVTSGDSLARRVEVAPMTISGTPWTPTPTWRTFVVSLASVGAQAGDRIVVEVGAQCSPDDPGNSNIFLINWGTTFQSGYLSELDAVDGDFTKSRAAWMEFSQGLAFTYDETPPPNDSCATATSIAAVPFNSAIVNSTTSRDNDRAVWYTWTADRTQRMFVTAIGSNFNVCVRTYSGSCGTLTFVTGAQRNAWLQFAQTVDFFNAVSGTTYFFKVQSFSYTGSSVINTSDGMFKPLDSGGAVNFHLFPYLTPEANDLFVDCQMITAFREGQPLNIQKDVFNQTPTGCAIDYTLRPMISLNGGVPNTEIRTLHGFFNGDPYIDIFTASTLEVNQVNPVDFLYEVYTDSPPARSQNISSVVMDRAGNVITGYYGDNYAVIDKLSTPIACAVRRTSGVYGDSQPGGPFPVAEHWIVQQENGGTDFVELSSDQETIWYTSGGRTIFRFNLTTSAQLTPFVTVPPEAGPRPGLRSVRLLPPGDGTGGLLVCDGINVKRLNASGAVIKVYTPSATDRAQDLDKVELTQDATQFWVSDQFSASLFKFDLASGAQLADVSTFLPTGQLSGFAIYLGYRAGVSPSPITPPVPICPPQRHLAPVDMGCIMPVGDF